MLTAFHWRDDMWISEQVCSDTQKHFDSVCSAILAARSSVLVEMYIFRQDALGSRLLEAMRSAARRGVDVRIVVDGFGSPAWSTGFLRSLAQEKIAARVYHPILRLPGSRFSGLRVLGGARQQSVLSRLLVFASRLNKRNHRKIIVVDQLTAFVGSCNVTDLHKRWRETAVRVSGAEVSELCSSFEVIWRRSSYLDGSFPGLLRGRKLLSGLRNSSLVRVNCTRRLRRRHNAEIVARIENAVDRVWVTTAYFVPSTSIVTALVNASKKGCDVRLLLPGKNDISLVSCVSRMFYFGLMRYGVKIYEYQPEMLHAKTLLIDRWACVGTTNLNHRSFYHDLEVDISLTGQESLTVLARQFSRDLATSYRVTSERLRSRSLIEKLSGYLVYPFRTFI